VTTEKQKIASRKWRKAHPERHKAASRKWAKAHPNKIGEYSRKYLYGIAEAQVQALMLAQENKCAVCRGSLLEGNKTCVDHNHLTNQIRGILCHCCNIGIGMFKDDPLRLELAADYLRKANL
jgi:hypothetical protein